MDPQRTIKSAVFVELDGKGTSAAKVQVIRSQFIGGFVNLQLRIFLRSAADDGEGILEIDALNRIQRTLEVDVTAY